MSRRLLQNFGVSTLLLNVIGCGGNASPAANQLDSSAQAGKTGLAGGGAMNQQAGGAPLICPAPAAGSTAAAGSSAAGADTAKAAAGAEPPPGSAAAPPPPCADLLLQSPDLSGICEYSPTEAPLLPCEAPLRRLPLDLERINLAIDCQLVESRVGDLVNWRYDAKTGAILLEEPFCSSVCGTVRKVHVVLGCPPVGGDLG